MNKKILLMWIGAVVACFLIAPVAFSAGTSGPAGNSNIGHLYLSEKDQTTWDPVVDGAWGRMKYNLSGETFDFVFNGHGLDPGISYTLIYYPDPWAAPKICFATGIANAEGDLNLRGSFSTGTDLPNSSDYNISDGAKIWLVLSSDVNCDNPRSASMLGWHGAEYLFEMSFITFVLTP